MLFRSELVRVACVVMLVSLGVGVSACAAPPKRKPIEMEPIGTVPNVPRTVDEGDGGATTTPNSGTPLTGVGNGKESACQSADFESVVDAFKTCEAPTPKSGELPTGYRDKLEIRVVPNPTTIPAGGHVDVSITLRNKSQDPLPLYVSGDPASHIDIDVFDAKGRRADLPSGKAPKSPPAPPRDVKVARLVLLPGGVARMLARWEAVRTKWAPDKARSWEGKGPPRAPAGPLPAGKYTLRVSLPLLGVFDKGEIDAPKVPIEVSAP